MSINGISNPLLATPGTVARPDATRPSATRPQAGAPVGVRPNGSAPAARPALKSQAPIAGHATQTVVPAEAPPGTDPTLWSVLTSEERSFFAKSAASGPLTYSRIKDMTTPATPSARGVRLDVRA
jgi:hypothetical protein